VKTVLIVGGGVAGIAAAAALCEAGFGVEIVEKRPFLGGRASSYVDRPSGARIDVCQHVTMRCCTNLGNLLHRLGVNDQIRYLTDIEFIDTQGRRSVIRSSLLPAPLHTALSFLGFRSLSPRGKLSVAQGMLAILRAGPRTSGDSADAATWMRSQNITEEAVRLFFEPVLVSACNESLDRIACEYALKVVRDGFLANRSGFHLGIPRVPLASLYTEPTVALLGRCSGRVRLRTTAAALEVGDDGVEGVQLVGGERLTADYYVSAVQHDLLGRLLPPSVSEGMAYFRALRDLDVSPIIGVHMWFGAPIAAPHALSLLGRQTDWVFNKTLNLDMEPGETTYLSAVVSGDREMATMAPEDVLAQVLSDVRACLPETRSAPLLHYRVLKEHKATFSPVPGVDRLRPSQASPLSNLYVAGEWTDTGWPSTMESAARSGYLAAEAILAREGIPARLLVPDLPPSWLARRLMRAPDGDSALQHRPAVGAP
jgi:squalene-associated FAD-dependent desaturase